MFSQQTNGVWFYEDAEITVVPGDTIFYWILVFINGGGYQKTDQQFTIEAATDPTTQTTTEPTTVTTTTSTTTTSTTTTQETTTPGVEIPKAKLEQIDESGLLMWVEDVEGLQDVAFHFSINEPLDGIDYGQENVDINEVPKHMDISAFVLNDIGRTRWELVIHMVRSGSTKWRYS